MSKFDNTLVVRGISFDYRSSGYCNRFYNDNESGLMWHMSHVPKLILHYFPYLKYGEEVMMDNAIYSVIPTAYDYSGDETFTRIKDFYLRFERAKP